MLDQFTVSVLTAVVVMASGAVFVIETLLRKDEGAGRVWALAYLAAMLTTMAYLIWAASPTTWWAIAIGNGTFVGGTALLWLGCRRFNRRPMRVASVIAAAGAVAAAIAVIVAGPQGGDWAGALVMFIALGGFATAGTVESLRGEMARNRNAIGLAIVLAVEALFYLGRIIVFLSLGTESEVFTVWFGPVVTSLLTVVLSIVAVVTTSVLRAGRVQLRGRSEIMTIGLGRDGVLEPSSFERVLQDRAERAERAEELVGVIAVRMDDLPQVATAFGAAEAQEVRQAWRSATRRYSPVTSFIGEDTVGGLLVGINPSTQAEARRMAARVHRGLVDSLGQLSTSVLPVAGVGVALSESAGYDPGTLIEAARGSAVRSTDSPDSSVIVAGAD